MRIIGFFLGLAGLYGPALLAQDKCAPKQLKFLANSRAAVPAQGANTIWGGSATQGDEKALKGTNFFTQPWKDDQTKAKNRGLETFLYTEGKCGKTNNKEYGEEKKCRAKERSWAAAVKNNRPDKGGPLWQEYTLAQFAAAKEYNVTYCEADNVEDNSLLIPFMKAFEKAYREGRIGCKLILKNVRASRISKKYQSKKELKANVPDLMSAFQNTDFIAPFAIFENDVGSQAGLDSALQELLKNPKATTIVSADSGNYGSRFTKKQIASCGSAGASPATAASPAAVPKKGATDSAIAFDERL